MKKTRRPRRHKLIVPIMPDARKVLEELADMASLSLEDVLSYIVAAEIIRLRRSGRFPPATRGTKG